MKTFSETLFEQNFSKTNVKKQRFLNFLSTKTLTNEQFNLYNHKTSETDLFDSIKKYEE